MGTIAITFAVPSFLGVGETGCVCVCVRVCPCVRACVLLFLICNKDPLKANRKVCNRHSNCLTPKLLGTNQETGGFFVEGFCMVTENGCSWVNMLWRISHFLMH